MIILRPPCVEDADLLFPLIYQTAITDTILWDGPLSIADYRQAIALRAERVRHGESHVFTMVDPASRLPVGMIDIRPYKELFRADIGLWIGQPFQGRGFGTQAVHMITEYGFSRLALEKVEASVFVGNWASRRIFEKNRFALEGTIRKAILKREHYTDEWLLGIIREDYQSFPGWIVHISSRSDWQSALERGIYRAASLESEGFIHASRPGQVTAVANIFFRSASDLVLLWIDPKQVRAELRWEAADGHIFPHIYGALNLESVQSVVDFTPQTDGSFQGHPVPVQPD